MDDGDASRGGSGCARRRRERTDHRVAALSPPPCGVQAVATVGEAGDFAQGSARGTPSAGSSALSRSAMSSRLTRFRPGT